jgi:outer membrane protein OmpU
MKKLFFATAALAILAPAAAKAEINLGLGGYFFGYAGYVDQDTDGLNEFDVKRKSKVFFKGSNKFGDDLTVGFYSELFQENAAADNISASYLYSEGSWGHVKLGDERGAPFQLQVAAPGADKLIDGRDIHISFISTVGFDADRDYRHSGINNAMAYGTKVTYLSPNMSGLRVGFSFEPEVARVTTADYEDGMPSDTDAGGFENYTEAAVRYEGKLDKIEYAIGGGYSLAGLEAPGAFTDDFNEWNIGLNVKFSGITVGGAYNTDNGGLVGNTGDTENVTVGIGYDWDAYHVGVNYFDSKSDNDDELERYTLGGGWQYGPGFRLNSVVGIFDQTDASTPANNNDGYFVTFGTDVRF